MRFIPTGNDVTTVLTGSLAGAGFDPDNMQFSIFASGTWLYLLQDASPFAVDQSTAALTKLGTVTGVPENFYGFTGAAGMIEAVPVPVPATWCMALAGLSAVAVIHARSCQPAFTAGEAAAPRACDGATRPPRAARGRCCAVAADRP